MKRDYDDNPAVVAHWLALRRKLVIRYLDGQEVRHRGVASQPDWFVVPYVSLWRVESLAQPGALGWWTISGNLPTDHLSGQGASDARAALREFATRWHEIAACVLRGQEHPFIRIKARSEPKERQCLGDLLQSRANILNKWAEDDEMW